MCQGLNVESGLNDGLALPFFLMFLAAIPGMLASEEGPGGVFWRALVVSSVVGLAFGWVGGQLLPLGRARGWVTGKWQQLVVLAVAFCAYSVATGVDGCGFIATRMGGSRSMWHCTLVNRRPRIRPSGAASPRAGGQAGSHVRTGPRRHGT